MTCSSLLFFLLLSAAAGQNAEEVDDDFTPIIVPTQKPFVAFQYARYTMPTHPTDVDRAYPPSSGKCPSSGYVPQRGLQMDIGLNEPGEHEEGWVAPTVPDDAEEEELQPGEHEKGWVAPTVPDDAEEEELQPGEHEKGWVAPTVPDDAEEEELQPGEHEKGWVAPTVPEEATAPTPAIPRTPAPAPVPAPPRKTFRPYLGRPDSGAEATRPGNVVEIRDEDSYESTMASNGQVWYLTGLIACAVVVLVW